MSLHLIATIASHRFKYLAACHRDLKSLTYVQTAIFLFALCLSNEACIYFRYSLNDETEVPYSIFWSSVCRSRVDLGILIDASRSVGRKNFRKVTDFLKSFVSFFPLSTRETRVGVMVFHSRSRVVFGFNRYSSRTQVVRAIGRIRFV